MDYEQSHQELVKCVVVGDTAVGKTRLICAKACNLILDLSQLMTTHIPTVWAIDQYRIHKEVLERSWEVVDGVNVSLRLWDTFGDHDKDRRFAYGRSDVVLLCFSIANPLSLRNCKTVWYPEIRKFCPNTPIVLVGCKNDLRYMFRDEKFQSLCRERSPFFRVNHLCCRFPEFGRPLKECDILTPEQGRNVAKEINASYYETSVFTGYGVKQVFENVIRAALIARRQQRFLMTSLKHVRECLLQEPFLPPKPPLPQLMVPASQYGQDIWSLFTRQAYTDVVFVDNINQNNAINCHKIILISASDMFNTLFTYQHYNHCGNKAIGHFWNCIDSQTEWLTKCASDISIASSVQDFDRHKHKLFSDDSLLDIRFNHIKHLLSASLFFPIISFDASKLFKHSFNKQKLFSYNKFHHSKHRLKLFQQKLITLYKNVKHTRPDGKCLKAKSQSVISFGKNIPFEALKTYISLLYSIGFHGCEYNIKDLYKCMAYLDFVDFDVGTLHGTVDLQCNFINKTKHYIETFKYDIFTKRFAFFGIEKGLFSDVIFKLDDGTCYAHKAVLMARCEVMEAMFKGDFMESLAQMIVFPNVTKETFYNMLFYIYTDMLVDNISHRNCLPLIELANRFCLTRLIALIEERVVNELVSLSDKQKTDITSIVLKLLEPCQIHNADQLSEFCLYYITTHYNEICHNHTKLLRTLHPENQAYLNRNRWPPTWYLKEYDYFERCVREREWQENPKSFKRHRINGGCFCFSPKPKSNRNNSSNLNTNNNNNNKSSSLASTYSGLTYKIIGIM